jgi:hypothetical protein
VGRTGLGGSCRGYRLREFQYVADGLGEFLLVDRFFYEGPNGLDIGWVPVDIGHVSGTGSCPVYGAIFLENEESREKLTWDTYQGANKCHEKQTQQKKPEQNGEVLWRSCAV